MISNGIDGILAFFEEHSVMGMLNLQGEAEWMIYIFAIIDMALTALLSPNDVKYRNFILKTFRYGFFLYIIRNFQDITQMMFKTFATAGSVAASGNANAVMLTPGGIWNKTFEMISNLWGETSKIAWNEFGLWFLILVTVVFCAVAGFKMVFQFLEMKIEFCIFSSLAVFFIPFSCISHLSFLFQRILTGFFSSLTKIMVMYFMLALVQSEIIKFSIAVEGNVNLDLVNVALRFLVMGLIVARLPEFAANIMSGSPAMGGSIGSFATGATVGAASMAVKGAIGGAGFAAGAAQQVKDRMEDGASFGKALKGTTGAVVKDALNAAAGNPAKVWFAGYDRGQSQTLRRMSPFEHKNKQPSIAERQQASIDVAKMNTAGKYNSFEQKKEQS